MKDMTDEEADYWDEHFTTNTIIPDLNKPGFFSCKYGMTVKLDPETTQILAAQVEATNKSFTEIIRELVKEKMELANIRNREAYIRKMILDGYVVRLDLSDVRKMVQLLSNATSNLNQIAKRANETRSVFESDITDLQAHYEKLWEQAEAILRGLVKLR
jgi:predicted transcriptional regulator